MRSVLCRGEGRASSCGRTARQVRKHPNSSRRRALATTGAVAVAMLAFGTRPGAASANPQCPHNNGGFFFGLPTEKSQFICHVEALQTKFPKGVQPAGMDGRFTIENPFVDTQLVNGVLKGSWSLAEMNVENQKWNIEVGWAKETADIGPFTDGPHLFVAIRNPKLC